MPRLAAVITVNGIGEVVWPLLSAIARSVVARRTNQATGVLTMAQRNAVLVHVHRRHASLAVGMDYCFLFLPTLATIFATIKIQRCWGMSLFNKGNNFSAILIDCHTATLKPGLSDGNLRPPCFAAVLAAPGDHAVRSPGGNQRAVRRDDAVRVSLVLENLLKLH